MSPVASGPTFNPTRAILLGVVAVAVAVGLLVAIVSFTGSGSIRFEGGDDTFEVGDADSLADDISARGPLFFPSLSRDRPIWLNHLGVRAETDWFAFDARSPGAPSNCAVEWVEADDELVDTCDPTLRYPPDGAGLPQYEVTVTDDGTVIVDLRGSGTINPVDG